jgi:hypothetical protein
MIKEFSERARYGAMIKKRITYFIITFFLAFSFPISAFADTAPADSPGGSTSTDAGSTPPAPAPAPQPAPAASSPAPAPAPAPAPGPSSPTGDDANTYTYNASTGLWENPYYTWDPVTHQTQPKTTQDYSYNPATGMWDTTQYVYNAPTGTYVPNIVSTPNNPTSALSASSPNNISDTGPGSSNNTNTNSSNNAYFNLFYNAKISNSITQNATSGAAAVIGNTVGGDALTGNALDVTNILNMLKASFGLQNAADLLTFTQNINGDVTGDITIDPNQINNSSVAIDNSNRDNNLTINANGSGLINNDVTLGANSGNATVADNTHAGNATTGNANAVANIVNMLNSAISANKSFLGVININGNLNGDILLPPNFVDQLLAANAPHSTVTLNNNVNNNVVANATNNETIGNNVNLSAASGGANVSNNTNAGSATTGSANTQLTIFNLTGKQVAAKDSILVFVNVLGQWVGLIMNAPNGTTAAALGGNVTENNNVNNNATINETTNNTINNNVKVASKSGDATVTDNTTAGNARSGNATASANIANIIDSTFSASDWFGLLFINVLGFWHGSFGVNTDAGNLPTPSSAGGSSSSVPTTGAVFRFVPKKGQSTNAAVLADFAQVANTNPSSTNAPKAVLASSTKGGNGTGAGAGNTTTPSHLSPSSKQSVWILPAASFAVIMLVTGALGSNGEFTDKFYARFLSHRMTKN